MFNPSMLNQMDPEMIKKQSEMMKGMSDE